MAQKKDRPLVFLTGENLVQYKFIHAHLYDKKYPSTGIPCILTMKRKNSLPWSGYRGYRCWGTFCYTLCMYKFVL